VAVLLRGVIVSAVREATRFRTNSGWEWAAVGSVELASAGQAIDILFNSPLAFGFVAPVFAHETDALSRAPLSEPIQKLRLRTCSIKLVHFTILLVQIPRYV
jgi:hypothetical protein